MITVVIKPKTWRWTPPSDVARLVRHAVDYVADDVWESAPERTDTMDDVAIRKFDDERAKYDAGYRKVRYDAQVTIPLDVLSYFLPCEVEAIHGHLPITAFEARVEPAFNTRVNVAVPGPALVEYTDVTVESDACTDHLQTMLDRGWRIIAVCVQPDQRRPDYILGRNKDAEDDTPRRRDDTARKPMPVASPAVAVTIAPATPATDNTPDADIPF